MYKFIANKKPSYFFILVILFTFLPLQAIDDKVSDKKEEKDCVFCAQFVPDCGAGEKLVPQTCEQCAHCEPEVGGQKSEDSQSEIREQKLESKDLTTDCQQCIIHAQCPYWHKCIDGCCVKKPHRRNPDVVMGRKQENRRDHAKGGQDAINRVSTRKTISTALMTSTNSLTLMISMTSMSPFCKNSCGTKCCKQNEKCITIDQCKGIKGKCKLPMLRFCSAKPLEKITGQLNPL